MITAGSLMERVRNLSGRFTKEQLDRCSDEQVAGGTNSCEVTGSADDDLNALVKAAFVRSQMDKGMTQTEAMRDLARRMRRAQGAS